MGGSGNKKGGFRDRMSAKGGIFVNKFLFFEGVLFECERKWNREGNYIYIGCERVMDWGTMGCRYLRGTLGTDFETRWLLKTRFCKQAKQENHKMAYPYHDTQ